jgi:PqqD family protein of HPr-rel-A system
MLLKVAEQLKLALFDDGLVVFDPNSGQTHNIDNNSFEILQYIQTVESSSIADITQYITTGCNENEKTLLSQYIQDIINNLIQLNIIKVVECN